MGLQIGELVTRKDITLSDLKGKIIAVDAFNALYQFLSSIRQPDGAPLVDSSGNVTSHLSGLFYRNTSLLLEGIKLAYVFDGEYHELKSKTQEKRAQAKESMREKYDVAVANEDFEGMSKYSRGFIKLNESMIAESKELLTAMGVSVIQAPGEGEMQCAHLVRINEAYAVSSQDYDALVTGGRLIQNLTLSKKRRLSNGDVIDISPQMIEYEGTLTQLDLTQDQLICLSILVGTDFNPGGVKGIGPKKALTLVKEKKYPVAIFDSLEGRVDFDWKAVFEIFKKPNVHTVKIEFPKLNSEKIIDILVNRHDFSKERVTKTIEKLTLLKRESAQRKLF